MATIKLQNGKVITKDGKVSCECCGGADVDCNESFQITDRNVFQITKEEYNEYVRGGTWSVSLNETQSEIGKRIIPARNASITGSTSYSKQSDQVTINRNGCSQIYFFSHSAQRTFFQTDPANLFSTLVVPNSSWGCRLEILLKKENNNYYVKFSTRSSTSATEFNYSGVPPECQYAAGSPPNQKTHNFNQASHTVNGNSLSACIGIITLAQLLLINDTLISFPEGTYLNTNSSSIDFTFTPNL
jgi:hypothetical protein